MATYGPEYFTLKDGRPVVIRHCGGADADQFNAYSDQIAAETEFTHRHPGQAHLPRDLTQKRWAARETSNADLLLGVFDGGRLVGQLTFHSLYPGHPWKGHVGYFAMTLLKDYWGLGLGRRLLEIQEGFAARIGLSRIEAVVRADNLRALKLYKAAGYEIEGTRRHGTLINNAYMDEYYIAKLLGRRETAPAEV